MSYCINPNCPKPQNSTTHIFCQTCSCDLVINQKYRVVKKLAQGGFANTYEVTDFRKIKVLKVLHKYQPTSIRLFKQEAEVLQKLSHPGIPKVGKNDFFSFQLIDKSTSLLCLIMEKIEGITLEKWLQQQKKPINQKLAIGWLKQITEILQAVHAQQFFHRDIKPANIILRPNGQLTLIDFGTVKSIDLIDQKFYPNATLNTITYTPGYAPSEQENGYSVPQSDFFALGRTLIHLLTNKHPLNLYNPHLDRLEWRQYAPQISEALADYIDCLSARLPQQRPKNTSLILQQLAKIERATDAQSASVAQMLNLSSQVAYTNAKKLVLSLQKQSKEYLHHSLIDSPKTIGPPFKSPIRTFRGHQHWVSSVAISPDSQYLASSSWDKTVKIWQLDTGQVVKTLKGHQHWVSSVAISPDGQYLASSSRDCTVKIWHLRTGQPLYTLRGHCDWVNSVAISLDGQYLVSGSRDCTVKIWDLRTGQHLHTLTGHRDWVNSVAISPNGEYIASSSWDKTIRLWRLTGQHLHTLTGHRDWVNSVAISHNGEYVVSGSRDKSIRIWHSKTGQQMQVLNGHSDSIQGVAISPNGKYLVSGGWDYTIKLWYWASGSLLTTFKGHEDFINSVVFSQNQGYLASCSDDRTVKIWQIDRV